MIYIEERYSDNSTVEIHVHGRLDREALPTLIDTCQPHLKTEGTKIVLRFIRLESVSLEAKTYLQQINHKVTFEGLPAFLKLELDSNP